MRAESRNGGARCPRQMLMITWFSVVSDRLMQLASFRRSPTAPLFRCRSLPARIQDIDRAAAVCCRSADRKLTIRADPVQTDVQLIRSAVAPSMVRMPAASLLAAAANTAMAGGSGGNGACVGASLDSLRRTGEVDQVHAGPSRSGLAVRPSLSDLDGAGQDAVAAAAGLVHVRGSHRPLSLPARHEGRDLIDCTGR